MREMETAEQGTLGSTMERYGELRGSHVIPSSQLMNHWRRRMLRIKETVDFKLIACPLCEHQFIWLGSRLPSFCPDCGRLIIEFLRADAAHVLYRDPMATLEMRKGRLSPRQPSRTHIGWPGRRKESAPGEEPGGAVPGDPGGTGEEESGKGPSLSGTAP